MTAANRLTENRFIFPHRLASGEVRTVEVYSSPLQREGRSLLFSIIHDVTEQHRAEQSLKKSEERFRTLVEDAPVAIGISRNGTNLFVNRTFLRMFGYDSADELLGRPLVDHWAPEWRPILQERAFKRAQGAPAPTSYEGVALAKDGSRFSVHVAVATVDLPDGPASVGFLTNVTEREQAEQSLRTSERRFASAFELAAIGMALVSLQGQWLKVNRALCQMVGYTAEELCSMRFQDLTHPEDLEADAAQTRRLLAGEIDSFQLEKRYFHKDGRILWILLSVSLVKDDGGRPLHFISQIHDITQRRRAEEERGLAEDALKESEERYRLLVELSPDAVLVHKEGRIAFANASAAALFGASAPGDLVGTEIYRLIHPDFRAVVAERSRRIQRLGESVPREEQKCLRLDGTPFDIEVSSAPILWLGARSSLTMIRDTSDRKRTEEALRESERELRSLLVAAERHAKELELRDEALKSVSAELDLSVIFRTVVESLGRVLGYAQVSIYVREHDDSLVLQHQIGYRSVVERIPIARGVAGRVFRSGIPELIRDVKADPDFIEALQGIVSEICIPLRDQGRPVGVLNVESTGTVVLTDADLRLVRAIGEQVDIALSKARLYAEANANARRYSDLVTNLGEGIAVVDLEERFRFANPAAEAVFGVAPGGLVGRSLADFLSPAELAHALAETVKRRQGESSRYELVIRRTDGETRQIEVVATPQRDPNDEVTGTQGIFRDVTDVRRAEEERARLQGQLQQAQKMEAVGRLAGGVAHDFNNLLQVIIGYSELALGSLTREAAPSEEIRTILDAARRSVDLTRQLLAFARKQEVAPRVIDLNESISKALKMLRRLIGEDVELIWKPGPSLWLVKVDPAQVDQILVNLATNSRDAIEGVGELTVTTSNRVIDAAWCRTHEGCVPGAYVVLTVSDTGKGMAPDVLQHVFEPFFTTKGVGQGTGLGLATVYGIVKQNRGFVDVQSEPGLGSTFRILLPSVAEPAEESPIEPDGTAYRGSETILVVEDEDSIAKLTERILTRPGYSVLRARTPGEALDLVQRGAERPTLLLTDVVMPEMNGKELFQRLLARQPDIKALFMSGYTADVISQRGVIEEGTQFIQKPFSSRDLAVKVREVLDRG